MHSKNTVHLLFVACMAGMNISCSDDNNTQLLPKDGLQVVNSKPFGTILTTESGKALYFFATDANGSSNCNGPCGTVWPAYYSANATQVHGINPKDIGVITRQDGKKQNTYKGWPLYTYSNDVKHGDIKGDAIGGTWYVAKPDYVLMVANAQLTGADGKNYLANTSEGNGNTIYFTNGAGRTLYTFTQDRFNKNNYTSSDFSNDAVWPIYQSEVGAVPSVIKKDLVGTIIIFGKKQLTYQGRPLYYFGQDTKRGENKGVSVPRPGVWPIVTVNTTQAPR